MGINSQIQIFY